MEYQTKVNEKCKPFCFVFQFFKVLLVKIYKICSHPVLLLFYYFPLAFTLVLYSTLYSTLVMNFPFLMDSLKSNPNLPPPQQPKSPKRDKSFCCCSLTSTLKKRTKTKQKSFKLNNKCL